MTHSEIDQREIIDRYVSHRLPPEVQAEFEEHYFACEECVEELESVREVIGVVAADRELEEEEKSKESYGYLLGRLPAWGFTMAGMAVLAVVFVAWPEPEAKHSGASAVEQRQPVLRAPIITLESYRGMGPGGARMSEAIAAKPFMLRLDVRGVSQYQQYGIDIVGESGEAMGSQSAIRSGGDWLDCQFPGGTFQPGSFWVRLSGVREAGSAILLREYSLVVNPGED